MRIKLVLINLVLAICSICAAGVVFEGTLGVLGLAPAPTDKPSASQRDPKLEWRTAEGSFQYMARDAKGHVYEVRYSTTRFGFREFGSRNSDRKKVLFIGDSFTKAHEVSDAKTYYHILKTLFPIEVFAYGGGGYGTLQEYLILDEFFDQIKPDVVVWQFCTNDIVDNSMELQPVSKTNNPVAVRPYLDPRGDIVYRMPLAFQVPRTLEPMVVFGRNHSKVARMMLRAIHEKLIPGNDIDDVISEQGPTHPAFRRPALLTDEIVRKVRRRCAGCRMVSFCVDKREPHYSELESISWSHGIPFMRGIAEAIEEAEQKGVTTKFMDGAHWNEEGHRICAESLLQSVSRMCRESTSE